MKPSAGYARSSHAEKIKGRSDVMVCPYFKELGWKSIFCKRGHSKRAATFKATYIKDKHIRIQCNGTYTDCCTYKKLQNEW